MDWQRLAQAVIDRRVELGFRTREAFASDTGLSSRLLGDLERAQRDNFDRVTLSRLERALQWPPGTARAILTGGQLVDGVVHIGAVLDDLETLRRASAVSRDVRGDREERGFTQAGVKPSFILDSSLADSVEITDQARRLSWLMTSGVIPPEAARRLEVAVEAAMDMVVPHPPRLDEVQAHQGAPDQAREGITSGR